MSLVRKIRGYESNYGQFKSAIQLTTDPFGAICIPDAGNHKIYIYDTNLDNLNNITNKSVISISCS